MRSKEERRKKCKGQESTIGKIIYGFLLFMPLMAIAVTTLVSTFNMNAKEETEITYKYQTNEVNSIDDLVEGNLYHFSVQYTSIDEFISFDNSDYEFEFININSYNFDNYSFNLEEVINYINNKPGNIKINFLFYENSTYINIYLNNSDDYLINVVTDTFLNEPFTLNGDFIYKSFNNPIINNISFISSSTYNVIESVETHNLDTQEVFYRAIDKVQQSPLFNWAENSIIYTTTSTTCNALSITAPFIPLLLSYWLIISVIYFLYDIALMLIWIVHRKIHDLQDSI